VAVHSYDLVIVGAGSGSMLPTRRVRWLADRRGGEQTVWRHLPQPVCIPSKMLVHTADVAQTVRHVGRFGIGAKWAGADWPVIRDRVFGRIDPHEPACEPGMPPGAEG
jgi:mycothione reductase